MNPPHIPTTQPPTHDTPQTSTTTLPSASTLPPTVRGRGLSTSAAASSSSNTSSTSSRDRYVSPHDWAALTRDYGKSEVGGAAGAQVEVRTIRAEVRALEEQGSRYSRRLRKRESPPVSF